MPTCAVTRPEMPPPTTTQSSSALSSTAADCAELLGGSATAGPALHVSIQCRRRAGRCAASPCLSGACGIRNDPLCGLGSTCRMCTLQGTDCPTMLLHTMLAACCLLANYDESI